ncbi:uncharacterized protein LOC127850353 [Dreissena polymorpha]|uniref:uncharacterized protein LOC127850353 n=1 Tax=Dreissena polymorpha TaxID=45954 RepID=UPI0022653BB0|nr:uncharacterized protein LOC127850353 [Dreissena polymorpha]
MRISRPHGPGVFSWKGIFKRERVTGAGRPVATRTETTPLDINLINTRITELENGKHSDTSNLLNTKGNIFPLISSVKNKIVNLVGEKCVVNCSLNETNIHCLWDTGAQVSIIPSKLCKDLGVQIQPITHITGLNIESASVDVIPYDGFVNIQFKIGKQSESLDVPFLVSSIDSVNKPIIGFNVITIYQDLVGEDIMGQRLVDAIDCLSRDAAVSLCKLIRDESDYGQVKIGKNSVTIPAGTTKWVKCFMHCKTVFETNTAYFELAIESLPKGLIAHEVIVTVPKGSTCSVEVPIENNSYHDIVLPKRQVLGSITTIKSYITLTDKRNQIQPKPTVNSVQCEVGFSEEISDDAFQLDMVNTEGLTSDQVRQIQEMLLAEQDAFSKGDNDVGFAPDLEMEIKL